MDTQAETSTAPLVAQIAELDVGRPEIGDLARLQHALGLGRRAHPPMSADGIACADRRRRYVRPRRTETCECAAPALGSCSETSM